MSRTTLDSLAALFDQVVFPLKRDEFLRDYWGKKFVRQQGKRDRFQPLLSWNQLNGVLEQHAFNERIRLVRNGRPLDRELYLDTRRSWPVINASALVSRLADGATLVIDAIDDLVPSVRELAEAIELVIRTKTQVNLYAGWRTDHGFDLHWDDHEVLILQIDGRKRWQVFEPTRVHPIKDDVAPVRKPEGLPVWDGILERGDMIHVPRGWWHVAFPLDEPCLHLTVSVSPPTAVDLFRWLADRLKIHTEVRGNLPDDVQADLSAYVSRLRELMAASLHEQNLQMFWDDWQARIPSRPSVGLPLSPLWRGTPLTMDTLVRLAASRKLRFDQLHEGDSIRFHSETATGVFARDLLPALQELDGVEWRSVRELCARVPTTRAVDLRATLTALSVQGALSTRPPNGGTDEEAP